jgi:putative membrane protein
MNFSDLPALNACLNGLSAVLLGVGHRFIRRNNVPAHRACMVAAFLTSILFLAGYLTYHLYYLGHVLHQGPTVFKDPAWFRPIYLTILLTHTVLAAVIVPLVLMTLSRALRGRFDQHRKMARWTWPLWMYVSVTGVIIYLLLYQIYPQR